MVRERAKEPPAKGVWVGGVMTAVRAVILGGWVNHTAKLGGGDDINCFNSLVMREVHMRGGMVEEWETGGRGK